MKFIICCRNDYGTLIFKYKDDKRITHYYMGYTFREAYRYFAKTLICNIGT